MSNVRRFKPTVQLDNGLIIPASAALGATLQSDAIGNALWTPSGAARKNMRVPELAAAVAVSTTNVAVLEGLLTVDGVVLEAEQIVLLTGQTTKSQNGPWIAAAGAWTRPTDFATGWPIKGARNILVLKGTVSKQTVWFLNFTTEITIDTTAQEWLQLPTGGKPEILEQIGAAGFSPNEEHVLTGIGEAATHLCFLDISVNWKLEAIEAGLIEVLVNAKKMGPPVKSQGPGTVRPTGATFGIWLPAGGKWEVKSSATKGALEGNPQVAITVFK